MENLPLKPDFSLKLKEDRKEETLEIIFNGPSIDNSVVNTIRRILLTSIPVYGFHRSNVKIERNTSVFHNDMMFNIFETLPIFDIEVIGDLIEPEKFLSNDVLKTLFSNYIQEQVSDIQELKNTAINPNRDTVSIKVKKIELYFKLKNETNETFYVTTHDAELYIDDKPANNYKNRPALALFILKPGQEFFAVAQANMGIAILHNCWDAIGNFQYKQLSSNELLLSFKTLGQINARNIFVKACYIILKKLRNLKNFLKHISPNLSTQKENKDEIEIKLHNETITLPYLVANALKKHKDIKVAASKINHNLVNEVTIAYAVNDDYRGDPMNVIINVIEYLDNLYLKIIELANE